MILTICSGDSYSTTGFNVRGLQPSSHQPFGNPLLPELEEESGANWPVYLATKYNRSQIFTYDFAAWGAVVDKATINADQDQDFTKQVKEGFLPMYLNDYNIAEWYPDNSLFAVWFGLNDISQCFKNDMRGAALEERTHSILEKYAENLKLVSALISSS